MPQPGGVPFEYFADLTNNSNNIAHLAVARKFRQKAPGYELVPETLMQKFDPHKTPAEQVVLFRADAKKVTSSESTRGVFPLDVAALIREYHLNLRNFSDKEESLRVMQSIFDKASKQHAINRLTNLNEERWHDYSISYNVRQQMLDHIVATLPKKGSSSMRYTAPYSLSLIW